MLTLKMEYCLAFQGGPFQAFKFHGVYKVLTELGQQKQKKMHSTARLAD